MDEAPRWVAIGRLAGPFGVRGECRITPLTEGPDALLPFTAWWLGPDEGRLSRVQVSGARRHGNAVVARLSVCATPEEVKALQGLRIWIPREELPPAGEDDYYWIDLVGCQVVDEAGTPLGLVDSLFATGANDVLVIREEGGGERLLPFIREVVLQVDLEARRITVHLLPGL